MLTLAGKTPAKFTWSDSLSETAVTLSPEDDSETLRDKLQRILDLEEGQGLPRRQAGAAFRAVQAEFPPLIDAQAAEAAVRSMGWTDDADFDALPEA